jgi:hypothetical protein
MKLLLDQDVYAATARFLLDLWSLSQGGTESGASSETPSH